MSSAALKRSLNDELFQLGMLVSATSLIFVLRLMILGASAPLPSAPPAPPPPVTEKAPDALPAKVADQTPAVRNAESYESLAPPVPAPPLVTPHVKGRWVVDQKLGEGSDVPSIGQALLFAAAGDHISVRKGVYQESIVIEKDVTISGETSGTNQKPAVVIEASASHAVGIIMGKVVLENLEINQLPDTKAGQHERDILMAILVQGGDVTLKNAHVTSAETAALWMDSAHVTAENVTFTGVNGIEQPGGSLDCKNCELIGSKKYGMLIGGAVDGDQAGKPTKATFVNLTGSGNSRNVIWATGRADVRVENSTIKKSLDCALRFDGTATGTLEGVSIAENSGGSVCLYGSANVKIQNSQLGSNIGNGITVGDRATVSVKETRINANTGAGIFSESAGQVTVEGGKFANNKLGDRVVSGEGRR